MEGSALISFFPRTEGDGMESMDGPITSDVKSVISSTTSSLAKLTLSPANSPTTERTINLVPQAVGVKSKSTPPGTEKKVKFVPYEPYRAAVNPIVPVMKKTPKAHCDIELQRTKICAHEGQATSQAATVSKKEYERVLGEKEELDKQLKIYSKVNAELKKLLVASVGEDMEARVHFLTEDKVKLGDDIRKYVEKIAADFEQKEKLSIEADIWRSKFLASSVVIEELTKWKSILCSRNDELQLCVNGMLDEMRSIQTTQKHTYNHLKALNKAFDPLGNTGRKSPDPVVCDVVESSIVNLRSAESLSKRLLGTYTQVRDDEVSSCTGELEKLSPAQLAAQQLLTRHPAGACSMAQMTSDATAQHVAALARRSMNKSFFTCCPHCTGQVHII